MKIARPIARIMAIFLSLVLVVATCGCSFGAPATTEELLVRYAANENVDNFHANTVVKLGVTALGVRATVPVTADFDAADNKAHGTITVDLSALDTRDYQMEVYAELVDKALVCYIGAPSGDGTTWKCWTIEMNSNIDIFTLTELLSASELTKIAKDSDPEACYELAVPTATVLETAFNLASGKAEVAGMDEQGMIDAVGNDKVRVDFTKDCLLRSCFTEVLANFKNEQTNNVPVRIELEVNAKLDKYGQIAAQSVDAPSDVRNAAAPTDEPVDVMEVIGTDSPLAGAVKQ